MTEAPSPAIAIYVDADACPVKQETYRVAERHGVKVVVVSNSPIAIPRAPFIERIIVSAGMDKADDYIARALSQGRRRHHGRRAPRGALRKGRRRRRRAEREAVQRRLDRHDARHTQPDGSASFGRRDYRRAEAVFAEGSIRVSRQPRSRDRSAETRGVRLVPGA